eukprot:4117938-Amphidinium_carterae.1
MCTLEVGKLVPLLVCYFLCLLAPGFLEKAMGRLSHQKWRRLGAGLLRKHVGVRGPLFLVPVVTPNSSSAQLEAGNQNAFQL